MEKRKPHYSLRLIQSRVSEGAWVVTDKASETALDDFGFMSQQIQKVVMMLTHEHFYKSMTAYHDHTVWHDVYHVTVFDKVAYLKISVVNGCVFVVSFKEK